MGEHDLFQKIGFIGLGLIGGSIAKKIHTLYPDVTIIATAGHQETITEAYGEHLISNQNLCEIKDFYDCDYIFLCTPVKRNIEYLRQLKGNIKNGCIITDVGSVKTDIHEEVTALAMEDCFIGGHPMAGTQYSGFGHARANLYHNAPMVIVPPAFDNIELLSRVQEGLGGNDKTKGVDADVVDDKNTKLDLDIVLEYGKSATDVFDQIKKVVGQDIKDMTGLNVIEMTVNVVDVMTQDEYDQKNGNNTDDGQSGYSNDQ